MKTRGEQMLALRQARMAAAPPFFRGGFRPFFLGGSAWAVIALSIWLYALTSGTALSSTFDPLAWHRHEMLFGFAGAVIAGFLLTAVPNWTGRLPIAGLPLASLFGLWIAARLAVLYSAAIGPVIAAVLDSGFFFVLAALAGREILHSKNRNLPVVGLIFLLGAVSLLDHAAAAGRLHDLDLAWKCAVALVIVMISLIGGRIIPSFTRNWLAKHDAGRGLPSQPTRFDLAVIAMTGVAFIAWLTTPQGPVQGMLFAMAAFLQAARLSRWKGWRTFADPLVLVLHIGYAWVPVGLALLAAANFGALVPRSAAVHALTAGAIGTMILAVMSRATLGHTGRELRANAATTASFVMVTVGALLRVTAPIGLFDYRVGMEVAGATWIGAFVLFLAAYGPMLFTGRVDGKL